MGNLTSSAQSSESEEIYSEKWLFQRGESWRAQSSDSEVPVYYAEAEGIGVRSCRLTSYLKYAEARFKPEKEEKKRNVETMKTVLEFLLEQMASVNELFDFLYQEIFYTGSFYDGLRITSASEFDLNIILALPFKEADRSLQEHNDYPAYGKYQLRAPATVLMERMAKKPPKILATFFDDENYLLPNKIRSWLQSVLDDTWYQRATEIRNFMQNNELQKITIGASGPARTLLITTFDGRKIDVDLVPVIQFRYPEWPNGAEQYVPLNYVNGICFLVPKPYFRSTAHWDEDVVRLWRLHFPRIERQLLLKLLHVKPIIKFLKKLRDKQNWKNLASYYLKTYVIWDTLCSKDEKWSGDLGDLFLDLLQKLGQTVKDRNLPYLFYPESNLLQSMSQDEADNISYRIGRIISSVKRDPHAVLFYLGCSEPDQG